MPIHGKKFLIKMKQDTLDKKDDASKGSNSADVEKLSHGGTLDFDARSSQR